MAKQFTDVDVVNHTDYPRIYAERSELVVDEPDWMKQGLQQTATGYGSKLNTGLKIDFNGRLYRLYAICFRNTSTVYFTAKGKRIYVS